LLLIIASTSAALSLSRPLFFDITICAGFLAAMEDTDL
jgi:hypothetical protein